MVSPDEIWLVDFGDPYPGELAHHRPAFIVGPARVFGDGLPFVVVAPLTTTRRGLSFHVEIEPEAANGLDQISYVQCELIRSISKRRLRNQLGVVDMIESAQIHVVVKRLLGH